MNYNLSTGIIRFPKVSYLLFLAFKKLERQVFLFVHVLQPELGRFRPDVKVNAITGVFLYKYTFLSVYGFLL